MSGIFLDVKCRIVAGSACCQLLRGLDLACDGDESGKAVVSDSELFVVVVIVTFGIISQLRVRELEKRPKYRDPFIQNSQLTKCVNMRDSRWLHVGHTRGVDF